MKRRTYSWLIILILIVLPFLAESSLQTTLSPSTADLCGAYPNTLTLTATNILNEDNLNLTNVSATLIIEPNEGGLFILTDPTVMLGDIPASNQSSIDPSWSIQCNPDFPGEYTLHVDYTADNYSSSSQNEAIITVHAGDTTPPEVLNHLPVDKVITPYITLKITTDEDASCRYSTTPEVPYDNMVSTFSLTGGISHEEVIKDLTDNRYHYCIKCEDTAGNKATADYEIMFDVDVPPTAQVQLSKPSPIGLGTVEVTLITSEEVKPIPTLSYFFDDGTRVSIPFSGHGTTWNGYMILQQSDNNKVGSFEFSGIDLTGNIGTVITSGNIFIVDTIPPEAPTFLTATERGEGSVRLEWRHNEEISEYIIYRSTENNDFSHYRTTTKKSFVDINIFPGETYYYTISAVDLAGNEGDLSEEVSITIGQSQTSETESPQETSEETVDRTELIEEIDAAITSIETLLDDISATRSDFIENNNKEIILLGIQEIFKEKKVELLRLKEELGILKSEDLDDTIITRDLKDITGRIKKIKSEIPKEISYGEKLTSSLDVYKEDISTILEELLQEENIHLSESNKEKYISKIEEIQESVDITTEAKQFSLVYLDDTEKEFAIITKEIVAEGNKLKNVVLIENIPKSIAQMEDVFLDDEFQFIKVDSMLKLTLDELDTIEFSYIIKNNIDLADIKEIITVILPDFQELNDRKISNKITGFVVSVFPEDVSFYDIGIIIGILLIVVLAFYSLIYSRRNATMISYISNGLLSGKIGARLNKVIESLIRILIKAINKLFGKRLVIKVAKEKHSPHFKKSKDTTLSSLIEKVNKQINKMNYSRAVRAYCLLNAQYGSIPYKKRSKQMKKQINRIHKKMRLFTKIKLSRVCLERKDATNFKYASKDITKLYKELLKGANKKEKKFLNRVKLYCNLSGQIVASKK